MFQLPNKIFVLSFANSLLLRYHHFCKNLILTTEFQNLIRTLPVHRSFESFPRKNGIFFRTCYACCLIFDITMDQSHLEMATNEFSSSLKQLFNSVMEVANLMPLIELYLLISNLESSSAHTLVKNAIEECDGYAWRSDLIYYFLK